MKTSGGLLERIAARENLVAAFHKAARGRRHSPAVRAFAADLDTRLAKLSSEFLRGAAATGAYVEFVIFDPKRRVIHAAPFAGRVMHHALMRICGPVFERGAMPHSCACRTGKGNDEALARAVRCAGRRRYGLKMDIRRYFDSIDHCRLKGLFRRLFREPALLAILDRVVDDYSVAPGRGLPIGALTSQYFANHYLDAFDRWVVEGLRCPDYVRFMDDFALWADSRSELESWTSAIEQRLAGEFKLALKAGTRLLPTRDGMPFLGFRVMPDGLLLGRRGRRRFCRRWSRLEAAWRAGSLTTLGLQRRVHSILAHVRRARCLSWRRALLAERGAEPPGGADA